MPDLHPLLADRWSPRAFDRTAELTQADLASLVEAARWAPSHADSQPCRFLIGLRDTETHKRIFTNLAEADQRWAGGASALILAGHLIHAPGGAPLPRAAYDLGQAVAHVTIQATALGLHTRQIDGFDAASMRADLDLAADLEPVVVVAVGRLGDPGQLPDDLRLREFALRSRRPARELQIAVI